MTEPENLTVNQSSLMFGPGHKTNHLQITNGGRQWVTYKLKTSNPVSYLVKPRMGYIPSGATETVAITYLEKEKESLQDNRFRLEVRKLTDAEVKARAARAEGNTAAVQEALGIGEKEAEDPLTYIWKAPTSLPCKKILLDCTFDDSLKEKAKTQTPRKPAEPIRTPQQDASPSTSTDVQNIMKENEHLKRTVQELEQQKTLLASQAKTVHVTKEELQHKAKGGLAVPFWLFIILWVGCFYFGLAHERLLPPSALVALGLAEAE